tara:strand:+ start:224 stop:1066 length:843 start_codon:yes stop_codon:yes gene_type:complete
MIIWLASYPKSGNTLVRSLLSSYFFSEDGEFNFEMLKKIDQFPHIKLFNQLGIDLSNKEEVEKNYIEAQKIINKEKGGVQFWKTHNCFCKFDNKYPFTDLKNTAGVIYIVRDPRNVVSSYAHHYQKSLEDSFNDLKSTSVIKQSKNDQLPVLVGSWNFNYNSWKQLKSLNKYILIKYEDLISDTEKTFINIINFISKLINSKIEINEKKLKKVIEATSFEKIQKLEKKSGFSEAKIKKNGEKINFFNLGPENKWEKNLDPKIKNEIENTFRVEMKEIGYL